MQRIENYNMAKIEYYMSMVILLDRNLEKKIKNLKKKLKVRQDNLNPPVQK